MNQQMLKLTVIAVLSFLLGACFSYFEFTLPNSSKINGTLAKIHSKCCSGFQNRSQNRDYAKRTDGGSMFSTHNEMFLRKNVPTHDADEEFHANAEVASNAMADKVRVLCMILTHPRNHHKANHIKATWGKRCNVLLFMSTKEDETVPTIALPVKEGTCYLWGKVKEAYKYANYHNNNTFDWVFVIDDDSYVVMENLRYLLSGYNSSKALHFGRPFRTVNLTKPCTHFGAGSVLSKEAVRLFVEEGLEKNTETSVCRKDDEGYADFELSKCLESLSVKPTDSRDSLGRERFLHFSLKDHFFSDCLSKWYRRNSYYPPRKGLQCCSDLAISFHFTDSFDMYILEYVIYHLHPFGLTHNMNAKLNQIVTSSQSDEGLTGQTLTPTTSQVTEENDKSADENEIKRSPKIIAPALKKVIVSQ